MNKLIWGPILDNDLMRMNDIRSIMNRKSDFYPYDVYAVVNSKEVATKYVIEVALAGIRKEDIKIQLTVEGGLNLEVTPVKERDEGVVVLRNNISYAKKAITFDLVKECDINKITSKFENGLLTIEIPMIVPESKARSIKIG